MSRPTPRRMSVTALTVASIGLLMHAGALEAQRRPTRGAKDLVAVAEKMAESRIPAEDAVRKLMSGYGVGREQALLAVAAVYPPDRAVAAALRGLRMSPEETATTLRRARVSAEALVPALTAARTPPDRVARSLRSAGYDVAEATRGVVAGTRARGYDAYALLQATGYEARLVLDALAALGEPLDQDCVGADGLPVPCGNFGSGGSGAPTGQLSWDPVVSGPVGGEIVIEGTNIPEVDVLFDGQELELLEMSPSRVRARLPETPGVGALELRRLSDGVVGVVEDPYEVVEAAFGAESEAVDWGEAADVAFEAALEEADAWIMASRFDASRCRVDAGAAIGTAGVLSNPAGFEGSIETRLLDAGFPAELASAWQEAFEDAFRTWADGVTIPGLPWYPSLTAFPGAEAPPVPNVPTPLVTLVSGGAAAMTPPGLAQRLNSRLPAVDAPGAQQAIALFATELGGNFAAFLATAQVMNVLGEGPVPTFQPPNVPLGPVVDGTCHTPGMWSTTLPSGLAVTLPDLGGSF